MLIRILPEFVTIVVGVLVALQVESWRDAREASGRELEQLVGLRSDFAANRERYESTMLDQERMIRLSRALLIVIDQKESVPSDSVALMFDSGATSWYEVEPVTGAYDALIASGDIGLLRDVELRRHLAEFYGDIAAGFEDHDNLMDILFELERETAPQLFVLAPRLVRDRYGLLPVDASSAASAIVGNDRFAGLLFLKTRLEELRLDRQKRGAEAVEIILELIDNSLGEH